MDNRIEAIIGRTNKLRDLKLELCSYIANALGYVEQRLLTREDEIEENQEVAINPIWFGQSIRDELEEVMIKLQDFIQQAKLIEQGNKSKQQIWSNNNE